MVASIVIMTTGTSQWTECFFVTAGMGLLAACSSCWLLARDARGLLGASSWVCMTGATGRYLNALRGTMLSRSMVVDMLIPPRYWLEKHAEIAEVQSAGRGSTKQV